MHWNMVTEVLKHMLELKEILIDLCDMHRFNGERSPPLHHYMPSTEEWAVLLKSAL